MDRRWEPTWPADLIEWPNFSVPDDSEKAASQIDARTFSVPTASG
jgi:hypothetical protein